MADLPPVRPGMTLGILGGGQLGRMLAMAAARLGLDCHVHAPDPDSPAFAVARGRTVAPYDDEAALAAFAAAVDLVTFEFENVPAASAAFLAGRVPVLPAPRSLEVAQDRLAEKTLLTELGIPVAPFAPVDTRADLYSALARTGRPAILKTRRLGYDGKGQATIGPGDDPQAAWRAIGEAPAVLERFVAFRTECSGLVARGRDGRIAAYDVPENSHRQGILATSRVPGAIDEALAAEAQATTARVAAALGHVGMLAVEFFVVEGEGRPRLLANEIAPRVHNSGHWTEDACHTSQFEQHVRAVCGWPLGSTARHCDVVMTNLIGAEAERWPEIAALADARLNLYGKRAARPGRKMGHWNALRPRPKR